MDDPASLAAARRGPRRSRSPSSSPQPHGPRTILLSVAGLSPQVITETLYCLRVQRTPPTDVREIHVLTTRLGAQKVRDQLLHPRNGWFHRFCREYGIPSDRILFDAAHIHVPRGADGSPLEDVRTPDDNSVVADAILALVRDLTRDPAVALHASVAGGRKTMGLFLGIAFQLFARPQDRLSHVLVSPPDLEGHREFFYPPATPRTFEALGKRIRSRDVRVELAEIPILLLREKVEAAGLERLSYGALIAEAQAELDRLAAPPPLRLDAARRTLRIADRIVRLTPVEFAVYQHFAVRRRVGCADPGCAGCATCGRKAQDFLTGPALEELRAMLCRLGVRDERARKLSGWDRDGDERFIQVRSRIERKVRDALGPGKWVEHYLIATSRAAGELPWYYLPLQPGQISFG